MAEKIKKNGELSEPVRCNVERLHAYVIDLYEDAREIVKERMLAENQKITDFDDEEKTRVEFSSTQTLRVMDWILSQGSHAVPVSPDWFVNNWKLTVATMTKRAKEIFD